MLMIRLAALGTVCGCLVGCEKTGTSSSNEGKTEAAKAAESLPLEVTTPSGAMMVYLPGSKFVMGDDRGTQDEVPAHTVRVSAFLMDKFEVTQEMFKQAQLPNPSHWQEHPKKPVERVRWLDAKRYCNERSLLEKLPVCYNEKTANWDCDYSAGGYRLPTEAEWEYACRAGRESGSDLDRTDKLRQYAWFADNSEQKTHIVGQKRANAFGIYDLLGNVSEWCEDVYSPTYYRESQAVDPTGPHSPGKDVKRVIRGGSWRSSAEQCRSSARQGERTGDTDACFATDFCGFRCVRRVTPEQLQALKTSK